MLTSKPLDQILQCSRCTAAVTGYFPDLIVPVVDVAWEVEIVYDGWSMFAAVNFAGWDQVRRRELIQTYAANDSGAQRTAAVGGAGGC
eukprot:COSAG06_NODE_355_length_16870_cov_21.389064_1_plen_88_part_00